jgi:hypothetical protein
MNAQHYPYDCEDGLCDHFNLHGVYGTAFAQQINAAFPNFWILSQATFPGAGRLPLSHAFVKTTSSD